MGFWNNVFGGNKKDDWTNPYQANVNTAISNWEKTNTRANEAIDAFSEAVDENKTRTSYTDDGRAYVEKYNAETGGWDTVNDFGEQYDLLDELKNQQYQTVEEWSDDNAHMIDTDGDGVPDTNTWDYYNQGAANAASEIGSVTTDYQDWARNAAATGMGFSDAAEMESVMAGLADDLLGGVSQVQGLSAEESETYDDLIHSQMRNMQSQFDRQLDAINAGSQSTMRYLAAADQVRNQMSDARLQAEYAKLEANFERQMVNYENKRQNYEYLVATGQASEQEYLAGVRADKVNAFQAYAQGATMVMQQRQLDLQTQQAHAQTIYNSINASMGISQHAIDTANQMYEQAVAPYMDQMNASLSQAELALGSLQTWSNMAATQSQMHFAQQQAQAQNRAQFWGGITASAVGLAAMFVPGGQAIGIGLIGYGASQSVTAGTGYTNTNYTNTSYQPSA